MSQAQLAQPLAAGPPRASSRLGRLAARIGWLAAAVVLSLGSAGIIGGMSQSPSTGSRPELTWAADQAVDPGLSAASSALTLLSGEVNQLGALGRDAIADLVNNDTTHLASTIASGTALTSQIGRDTAAIRQRLASLPTIGTADETMIGADLRQRFDAISVALSTTAGLQSSWLTLTSGSAGATALTGLLADHDTSRGPRGQAGQHGPSTPRPSPRWPRPRRRWPTRPSAGTPWKPPSTPRSWTQWIDRNQAFDTACDHPLQAPRRVTSQGHPGDPGGLCRPDRRSPEPAARHQGPGSDPERSRPGWLEPGRHRHRGRQGRPGQGGGPDRGESPPPGP